ncbi:MAG: oligosaccharide flippase family protein [Bacteroidetes bacterium]|nr:oligosaccharide flippase family protein [Bacteroidota bacterium]
MMVKKIGLNIVKEFFTKGHPRSLRAKKNITVSFITKGISIIISFLIVPLTLGYVGKVEYGIWMTISSIINWFVFFDIGLGNGLRNKLAEALAKNDKELARTYISSVFAIISVIGIILFLGFFVAANFISWNNVLNTNLVSNHELFVIVVMVFFFFCLTFIFGLVSSILQAMQRYAINDILGLIAQSAGLIAIFILVKTTNGSLFYLCLVYGSKTAVVMVIAAFVLFFGSLKKLRPSIAYVNMKKALPLLNLGVKFFLNQILYLIVTQTSVILVVQFFGPEDVTVFNLAVRYMTITSMVYIMVLTPFLSAFTEAYTKGEIEWIRTIMKRINWIWLLASFATILMVFGYKIFFKLWVGNAISIPFSLIIALAIFSLLSMWSGTYGLFLNSVGKIHLQIYILSLQALIFFPLSYLFYKLNFGLVSIVAAQIIMALLGVYFMTVQYNKIINQKASGIWLR